MSYSDEDRVVIPYRPRWYQHQLHERAQRFNVIVLHRRAGKTVWAINRLIKRIITCPLEAPQGIYAANTYRQVKRVAWRYVKKFIAPIPGVSTNESELTVHFEHNNGTLELVSGSEPDSLRGAYYDEAVIDEVAQCHPNLWGEVIRPALADRTGGCTFIGTPMGRMNKFYELFDLAGRAPGWFRALMTCHDTNVLPEAELAQLKAEMDPAEFEQELLCSWDAAIKGAFYARIMEDLTRKGRIREVPYDQTLPVTASLDLGMRDATVVGYWQVLGSEVRCLECNAYQGTALSAIVQDMKAKPWPVETVIAPHDAKVRELGTGRSRMEVAADLGVYFDIAPQLSVHEGINAVREMLPRVFFDAKGCHMLIEALRLYRAEFDERLNVQRTTPLHDWTSDFADMVRYFAIHTASQGGYAVQPELELFLAEADRVAI